jgi:hypothetical protein
VMGHSRYQLWYWQMFLDCFQVDFDPPGLHLVLLMASLAGGRLAERDVAFVSHQALALDDRPSSYEHVDVTEP